MADIPAEQMDFLKTRMKDYFSQLAAISEKYPPPAKNAAHGNWVTETNSDPKLKELEAAPPLELGEEAKKFYDIFSLYQSTTRQAFTTANHEDSWDESLQITWTLFKEFSTEIINVVTDIYNLFSDDKAKQDEAKKKVYDDLEIAYNKIKDPDNTSKGTHANGHISEIIAGAAAKTIEQLNAGFPKGATTNIGKIADSLRIVCEKIALLKTTDHKPWLRAEWQVGYELINKGAATGLAATSA